MKLKTVQRRGECGNELVVVIGKAGVFDFDIPPAFCCPDRHSVSATEVLERHNSAQQSRPQLGRHVRSSPAQ
ncbi:hypothetical protein KL864_31460 [Mycolicibacterium goodii]|uniref:hypothetical protein n=1 Tax=Mycolicibacterium goodii TaxID=134601 RepID=UPI001BDC475C|nr:hypothetical protein [Mycolicibacterium goodii]MBU8820396.1 hypothetical protein [Mycolicibacterium goodii]